MVLSDDRLLRIKNFVTLMSDKKIVIVSHVTMTSHNYDGLPCLKNCLKNLFDQEMKIVRKRIRQWMNECMHEWMNEWMNEFLWMWSMRIHPWAIVKLSESLTTNSRPCQLDQSLAHSLTHSLTHSLAHSLTHSLTRSLTQSLTHSFD